MILGTGIDAVEIPRVAKWLDKSGLLNRFFHSEEVNTINSRAHMKKAATLAARFAAKEAFVKAVGTGFRQINLADICLMNDKLGKPELMLIASAKKVFTEIGGQHVHVSLTHEKDYAIAMVIIEGE